MKPKDLNTHYNYGFNMGLTELVIKDDRLCKVHLRSKQNKETSWEPVQAIAVGLPQVATYTKGNLTKFTDLLVQCTIPPNVDAYVCGNPTSIINSQDVPVRTVEAIQFYRLI